jgi:2'-hydroxyisoflavone reductase
VKVLVLGGTHFVGRHIVATALERGHEVTLFNRGRSYPGIFPEAEHLVGDRNGDYTSMQGRHFDAVFDPSGYAPRILEMTCAALPTLGHYVFVSTTGVYDDSIPDPLLDEDSPLLTLKDPTNEDLHRDANYAPLKAASEQMIEQLMPGRTLVVRPGVIVGPHDLSDRLTYWARRVGAGGDVLAPAPPSNPVQIIDARDMADFMVRMAEEGTGGTFNLTGPRTTLEHVLQVCKDVTESDANIVWVDEDFLVDHGVKHWTELPLWAKPGTRRKVGTAVKNDRALRQGLRLRPLAETVLDTYTWDAARPRPLPRGAVGIRSILETLTPERETQLLELWAGT